MINFDLDEFLVLLRAIGVNPDDLSTLQLDQYIAAYKNGAHDESSLANAINQPSFPLKVDIYAHIDVDDLEAIGRDLNLAPNALLKFVNAAGPLRLPCTIESDGSLIVESVGDEVSTLAWGVVLN
jgi:hypothetical protein